ncbi:MULTISPECIES: hypothetical protein [Staphylococcus]|uniref:hypothetical protein n=1 Tax=Staphylococcus TaxID=1279 RepID=UPI000853B885|nr:hypothetical protein [Staphylococcus shinii]RQM83560.1 hypothetical protein CO206_08690 [Staphylococcus xylosus]MEC5300784.1 hypothetical protein [Staphylococcus shinii]OEK90048.1 hypothetical protein AST15_02640 [Staphylococcus shinii]PTI03932.1 hypothetical protein BU114_00550 [Staphylococcus shinii]PTI68156.1 hypothetical protein BU110_00325 [Staphylococcus shinii]
MSVILGIIVIILLIVSLIPNLKAYKKTKETGEKNPRFAIMIGIDAILLVLVCVTLIFQLL